MKQSMLMFFSAILSAVILMVVPLQIVSADNHTVRIPKTEMLVIPGEGELKIVQTTLYRNNQGEKVPFFIALPTPHKKPGVLSGIPENADVEYQENGIVVDQELPDGDTTVIVSYTVPLEDRAVMPVFHQPYLTEQIDVMIQINSLTVKASDFTPHSERVTFGEKDFRRFTKLNLHPKEQWPLLFRMYRGSETSTELYQIAGESPDDSLPIIGNVHEKNVPKAVMNVLLIAFILTIGMVSIRRSTKGSSR